MQDLFMKVFPGISQMENIHPLIVHFPIALLNAFFILELLGFILKNEDLMSSATWALYLGAIGAAAAVAAGLRAADTAPHTEEEHAIMAIHRDFGLAVLSLAVILSAWRIRVKSRFHFKWHVLHLILAFITITVMALGADRGGLMVYKYGVSVRAVPVKGHIHHGIFGDPHEEGHDEDHHPMEGMDTPRNGQALSLGHYWRGVSVKGVYPYGERKEIGIGVP